MADSPRALILAAALSLAACSQTEQARQFQAPIALSEVLGACGVDDVSTECVFQVTDGAEKPVPHALLRLDWPDLGRMSLQTDGIGTVTLRFPEDTNIEGVVLRVEHKPEGQDLLALPYEECTKPIESGGIFVRVR